MTKTYQQLSGYSATLAAVTACLLLIPFTAMQYTNEVAWNVSDFVIAGTLLFGTGIAYKLMAIRSENVIYKLAVGLALTTGLCLIWANLAVGIIGSESAPINMLYFGAIAVGIIGAIIARFKPRGMANTMLSTAFAIALIAIAAIITESGSRASQLMGIVLINGFFIMIFLGAAWLFNYSTEKTEPK